MQSNVPWGLLNQTVTRRRPIFATSARGSAVATGYKDQVIQMRFQEHRPRMGHDSSESVEQEGLVTQRTFLFQANYFTDSTLKTKTDILPSDSLIIHDATGELNCRITDLHDAAGQRHHISGTAAWRSPTGDLGL